MFSSIFAEFKFNTHPKQNDDKSVVSLFEYYGGNEVRLGVCVGMGVAVGTVVDVAGTVVLLGRIVAVNGSAVSVNGSVG